jgi:hypothetical protein
MTTTRRLISLYLPAARLDATRRHYRDAAGGKAARVTLREWSRLTVHERARRVAEFRAADEALQDYRPPGRHEDARYPELHDRVNELWPTVPWWWRR